jgi:hypothetical protein
MRHRSPGRTDIDGQSAYRFWWITKNHSGRHTSNFQVCHKLQSIILPLAVLARHFGNRTYVRSLAVSWNGGRRTRPISELSGEVKSYLCMLYSEVNGLYWRVCQIGKSTPNQKKT